MKFDKPLDDDSIEKREFEVMPEGVYSGFIEEVEERKSGKGNEMIDVTVKLRGNEKYNGAYLHYYLVSGGKYTLESAQSMMVALGQDISGLKEITPKAITGLPCKFKVKHETQTEGEYAGKTQARLHYFVNMSPEDLILNKVADGVGEIDLDESIPF